MVFWRVHALYLSADKSYRCLSLRVVSDYRKLAHTSLILECAVSHVTSVLAIHVSCIVFGTLRTTMICVRVFSFSFNLMALCHSQVSLMLSTDINITETTYSCQFECVFGNQQVCNSYQSFRFLWPLSP